MLLRSRTRIRCRPSYSMKSSKSTTMGKHLFFSSPSPSAAPMSVSLSSVPYQSEQRSFFSSEISTNTTGGTKFPVGTKESYPKNSTGIVGLDIEPDWRNSLYSIHEQQLAALESSDIPLNNAYREEVEKVARYRMNLLEKESDVFQVEEQIGLGHIEEVIDFAKDELTLIPKYASWRAWELPADYGREDLEIIDAEEHNQAKIEYFQPSNEGLLIEESQEEEKK
eukprot:g3092.t1